MNKLLLILCSLFCWANVSFSQADIAEARTLPLGTEVTLTGIVTNGEELGIIRYLQDNTAGIALYPGTGSVSNFPETVKRGDAIEVTGTLKEFNGLLEVDPISSFTVVSSNNALPAAKVLSPNEVNGSNEGELVEIQNATMKDGGSVFTGNKTYPFNVGGEESVIYVRTNHELVGQNIPLATVNITGIVSVFSGNYQVLPRDAVDLEIADDFYINSALEQTDIQEDKITISWTTNSPGTSTLMYGTEINVLDQEVTSTAMTTNHSVEITGLEPASFYYVQASSNNGNSTITSLEKIYSTASKSTGAMQIFFTREVDGTVSNGSWANGYTPAIMEASILDRISKAKNTIDVSMYNVNRVVLIQALTAAYNRGVQVRYIADNETLNSALDPPPPFKVIRGNVDGLMHNKFFVIDAASQDDAWVLMGSTNMTEQNLANDHNNMIFLQDQTIAMAYTMEFEEIWGTDGPEPGVFNLKFGPDKTDNTPHLFKVRNFLIESYFSPSDNTSLEIANALKTANTDIQVALLVLTNNELSNTLLSEHNAGISVRGLVDQVNSTGSDFEYLQNNGVNMVKETFEGSLHHKYCIIDATSPDSDPQVITGSHNWSGGADTRNDENTLIFHDKNIANIFYQEFEARWCESNAGESCTTNIEEVNEIKGFTAKVFPNPVVSETQVEFSLEAQNDVTLSLFSATGQRIQSSILRGVQGKQTTTLYLSALPSGNYFVHFNVNGKNAIRLIQKVD